MLNDYCNLILSVHFQNSCFISLNLNINISMLTNGLKGDASNINMASEPSLEGGRGFEPPLCNLFPIF